MTNLIAINDQTPNATLDRILETKERQHGLRFKFTLLENLSADVLPKDWIVKKAVAMGETSAWIGPPGSLKSALLGDLSFAVASGQDWHGYRMKRGGLVVYFALERRDLVERRLIAYRARYGAPEDTLGPIAILGGAFDLMDARTVKDVVATIRAAEQATGQPCVLTVWDTFAKMIAAGGGDENTAKDMGRVFVNLDRIKDKIGCHMALIGHTGKDESKGARGSNAFDGHVDVVVKISGEEIKTATVTKANDMPEGPLFSFKSEVHESGQDEDGDPVTVNVVSNENLGPAKPAQSGLPKLTPNQRTMFMILADAGSAGLLTEDWNAKGKAAGIGERRRADLTDARTGLKAKNLVREYQDRWHVQER
ncbi:MAG: AAA family ATPase [Bradyrhizobiaceae bacterium]|nr:MAG: AAA family ATPase [Bradyrhizobiaceae bacterium]